MTSPKHASMLLFAVILAAAGPVYADGPYEGQWREGALNIDVSLASWGGDCGPRPRSTNSPGGGSFRITQSDDTLTFHLRRPRTTRGCWSENRAVRRVSSTHQSGTWRIVCRTPSEDSRAETGTYTIQAIGQNTLQFRDSSRYDWQLNESSCRGTITTTQTFTRIGSAPASNEPEPEPERPRCTPGDAARIALRPASADVPPGGEQCFTARVVDSAGCPVRGRRPSLRVSEGGGRIERNCFIATDEPGSVRVVASAGSLRATARLTVRTMDLSDLIARRTETGSLGSGTEEDASAETGARLSARDADDGPGLVLPAIALAAALLLLIAAVIILRRRSARHSLTPGFGQASGKVGGLTGRPVPDPSPSTCEDGDPAPAHGAAVPAPDEADNQICPTCRRGYPASVEKCPHDDTTLMDYQDFAAGKHLKGAEMVSICPTCGERYAATVTFCGKDGATLSPGPDPDADT